MINREQLEIHDLVINDAKDKAYEYIEAYIGGSSSYYISSISIVGDIVYFKYTPNTSGITWHASFPVDILFCNGPAATLEIQKLAAKRRKDTLEIDPYLQTK